MAEPQALAVDQHRTPTGLEPYEYRILYSYAVAYVRGRRAEVKVRYLTRTSNQLRQGTTGVLVKSEKEAIPSK